jgi:hypothetical protein
MISILIEGKKVKSFMNRLTKTDAFDWFYALEIAIVSFARFEIYGAPWKVLRPYVYNILKGAEKPVLIKIVFSAPTPEEFDKDAVGLFLNVTFANNEIRATSGSSLRDFTNRALAEKWDEFAAKFIKDLEEI